MKKRIFDIIFSIFGLIIFSLIFPFIALAIKFDSQGPIFYSQYRIGKNRRKNGGDWRPNDRRKLFVSGKVFKMYKLRTMIVAAEPTGAKWCEGDSDPRITRVGKFLRKTHIDELPQLWNILKGDMSLVGPRPERPVIAHWLRRKIEGYDNRQLVLPGIAGLAQLKNGYDVDLESVRRKVLFDCEYMENQSVYADIEILFRTAFKIFRGGENEKKMVTD